MTMTSPALSSRDAGRAALLAALLLGGVAAANDLPPALCASPSSTTSCDLAPAWKDAIAAGKIRESLISYAVKCALPEDAKVVSPGGATFPGGWGLVPGWRDAALDVDGQEIVSACLLASINKLGEKVLIVIAGPDVPYDAPPSFRYMEGTFYGNVFARPAKKHVCKGAGDGFGTPAEDGDKRVCARDGAACGLESAGACYANPEAGCTRWAGTAPRVYCAEARDRAGTVWRHPITVYLWTNK
jgi:hypothetical protein